MRSILKNALCIVAAMLLTYILAEPTQSFYCNNIGVCSGGFFGFDLSIVMWMLSLYIFFIVFLLIGFGSNHKLWWIGIALIPAILFEVLIDPLHIYFPIVLGLIAWGLGYLANKALWKLVPGVMAKIS